MLKILCVGPMWRGSNAGGLFKALSRKGHLIMVIDEFYEIPLKTGSYPTKLSTRLIRKLFINDYNKKIIREHENFNPDIVLIYKGAFILPETLLHLKNSKSKLVNFYPDVSFHTHGDFLKQTLPVYDLVFSTKSFGVQDMKEQLNISNSYFIPHGFDPEVHRKIDISGLQNNSFINDVSFIGTWSPKKESLLRDIIDQIPGIDLKIFGSQWQKAKSQVKAKWMKEEVLGDAYALAINSSRINLGLLSEKIKGASSGDQITSRTFHIPASGGFLLHEETAEALNYFVNNQEIVCFSNQEEMIEKIVYYLKNDKDREMIAMRGYKRALKDHNLDNRADELLEVITTNLKQDQ